MCKKRNEGTSIEKELYLVDVDDVEPLVPNFKEELARFYTLWDAVQSIRSKPWLTIIVCHCP